jgi:hypothetical protein
LARVSVYAIPLVLRTRRLPRHLRGRFNGFRVNLNQVPQLPSRASRPSSRPGHDGRQPSVIYTARHIMARRRAWPTR